MTTYALFTLAQAISASDPDRALRLLDEAIATAESVGNDFGAFVCEQVKGALLFAVGDHVGAMRTTLTAATGSARAGHREHQGSCLWALVADFVLAGRLEAAATVVGWARSVLGDYRGVVHMQSYNASVDSLPGLLGERRYTELTALGAAMDDDEVLRLAHAEVESLLANQD